MLVMSGGMALRGWQVCSRAATHGLGEASAGAHAAFRSYGLEFHQ